MSLHFGAFLMWSCVYRARCFLPVRMLPLNFIITQIRNGRDSQISMFEIMFYIFSYLAPSNHRPYDRNFNNYYLPKYLK